jgi:uncharacterized protein (TIGR02246 family)
MSSDEEQIKSLVARWAEATAAGDAETVLSLIADDALFLTVGGGVVTKADFAAAAESSPGEDAPRISGTSDVQEVTVIGDWAFVWTKLSVSMTPPGGEPVTRNGHALSILKKTNGQWQWVRDANMLPPLSA